MRKVKQKYCRCMYTGGMPLIFQQWTDDFILSFQCETDHAFFSNVEQGVTSLPTKTGTTSKLLKTNLQDLGFAGIYYPFNIVLKWWWAALLRCSRSSCKATTSTVWVPGYRSSSRNSNIFPGQEGAWFVEEPVRSYVMCICCPFHSWCWRSCVLKVRPGELLPYMLRTSTTIDQWWREYIIRLRMGC